MAEEYKQQVQSFLEPLDEDMQLYTLNAVIGEVRQKRKNKVKAQHARRKYHDDPSHKQKVIEKSNLRTVSKYATDAEWRAKVRAQQRQYYHARKLRRFACAP